MSTEPDEAEQQDATATRPAEPTPMVAHTATGQFNARGRIGYETLFGPDGQDGSRHRQEGRSCDPVLGRLLVELWRGVLPEGSHPHRYPAESDAIDEHLDHLGPLDTPDLVTARRLAFLAARHAEDTIAKLISTSRQLQQELTSLQLRACVTEDENIHTREAVRQALQARGTKEEETASWALPELVRQLVDGDDAAALTDSDDGLAIALTTLLNAPEAPPADQAAGDEPLARVAQLRRERDEYRALLIQIGLLH